MRRSKTVLLPCPRTDKPLERHRHRHRGAKGRRHQPISDAFRTPTTYDGNGTANIRSRDLCRAVAVVDSGSSESVADWLMPSPLRSTVPVPVPVPLQRLVRSWAGEENGLTCDTALIDSFVLFMSQLEAKEGYHYPQHTDVAETQVDVLDRAV
ncbi:unnamed protein product [Nesidiocoris tenuis]|uniref:Uncharacterized protein n=1 Tax=Nesidiocoris tenuis TaxID=355587 RepID=A0A6H5HGL9_9HEMI|nr:unnamed protein product [Nesidiocoris tenuis]